MCETGEAPRHPYLMRTRTVDQVQVGAPELEQRLVPGDLVVSEIAGPNQHTASSTTQWSVTSGGQVSRVPGAAGNRLAYLVL